MKLGSYVADIEDKENTDPAIIVYDHRELGYELFSIKRASGGHLSLRGPDELKEIEPIDFMKVWCKDQIGYGEQKCI